MANADAIMREIFTPLSTASFLYDIERDLQPARSILDS